MYLGKVLQQSKTLTIPPHLKEDGVSLSNVMNNLMNEVLKHQQTAIDKGHLVFGTYLQGSQNYKLDLPTSDVDTKTIVIPTFEDIALNRKPISTTHILDDNSHDDQKDIRLMFSTFHKQNINFLEILFTDYYIPNPIFKKRK